MKELWSLDKIKELDFPSPTGFMKVRDFLPLVREEVNIDVSGQYAILKNSFSTQGQKLPLHISKDEKRLRDGIHRLAVATELGWSKLYVSTSREQTNWDKTPDGFIYWQLWNRRLRGFKNG